MNLKELIALIPEVSRAEAETVISDAVKAGNPIADIDSNDKAATFIAGNRFFKGAYDSGISVKVAEHDERFKKDQLPKLLESEIKKLTGPETDPIKLELAQIKAEREAEKAELKRERLKASALKIAAAEGIPVDDVDRFLADDEDKTAESVRKYASRLKSFRDAAIEAALKDRIGNVGKPQGGNVIPPADLKTQYDAAARANNGMEMLRLKGLMQSANKQE